MSLEMPDIDFEQRLLEVEKLKASDHIRPAAEYLTETLEFLDHGDVVFGDELPWTKVSDKIRVGRGQLSIWAGRNASGKSLLVGQVILGLLHERRAVIASFEMLPHETIVRMCRQAAGCFPSRKWTVDFVSHITDKLFIYNETRRINPKKVLGMCHYAFGDMGIDHVVIDSLTKCGFTKDDYNAQAKFIDQLQQIAKEYGKHIHLVAHSRKINGEQMGRDDIRGAGEISDLADNVFIVSRNHAKEDVVNRQAAGAIRSGEEGKLSEPDAYLRIAKNRKFSAEPVFGLWFDMSSQQFRGDNTRMSLFVRCAEDMQNEHRKTA